MSAHFKPENIQQSNGGIAILIVRDNLIGPVHQPCEEPRIEGFGDGIPTAQEWNNILRSNFRSFSAWFTFTLQSK